MKNNSTNIKNLTLGAMFLAIGVIMPRLIHFIGPEAGKMFLPLFWGVAFSSLILPLRYTLAIGLASPLISYLISGMPAVPILQFMTIELVVYAISVTLLHKKFNSTISIFLGLLISRATYIISVLVAANIFDLPMPKASLMVLISGIAFSLPGIISQVVLAPLIEKVSKNVRTN